MQTNEIKYCQQGRLSGDPDITTKLAHLLVICQATRFMSNCSKKKKVYYQWFVYASIVGQLLTGESIKFSHVKRYLSLYSTKDVAHE